MNTLFVMVKGNEKPVSLLADKVEEDSESGQLVATREGKIIGRFQLKEIAGWWLAD
jgi:hypothetical protein